MGAGEPSKGGQRSEEARLAPRLRVRPTLLPAGGRPSLMLGPDPRKRGEGQGPPPPTPRGLPVPAAPRARGHPHSAGFPSLGPDPGARLNFKT